MVDSSRAETLAGLASDGPLIPRFARYTSRPYSKLKVIKPKAPEEQEFTQDDQAFDEFDDMDYDADAAPDPDLAVEELERRRASSGAEWSGAEEEAEEARALTPAGSYRRRIQERTERMKRADQGDGAFDPTQGSTFKVRPRTMIMSPSGVRSYVLGIASQPKRGMPIGNTEKRIWARHLPAVSGKSKKRELLIPLEYAETDVWAPKPDGTRYGYQPVPGAEEVSYHIAKLGGKWAELNKKLPAKFELDRSPAANATRCGFGAAGSFADAPSIAQCRVYRPSHPSPLDAATNAPRTAGFDQEWDEAKAHVYATLGTERRIPRDWGAQRDGSLVGWWLS